MADVYVANDTCVIWERILADFAEGDVVVIEHSDDISQIKTGKNGNSIMTHNESGNNVDVTIRVLKGSPDDKFLNSKMKQWKNKDDRFTPANGEFSKTFIDENGDKTTETNTLEFGTFSKKVDSKDNTDGEIEQAVAIYKMKFARSDRSL